MSDKPVVTKEHEDKARELLDPILDVFGGSDGGVSFTRLRHRFVPSLLADPNRSVVADELVAVIERFSRLCQMAQQGRI